ncbi:MAG: hypothetical protein IT370_14345 [Deltaproteobacteria bacterium]|nr:hypothetical protein [Deltaproteobacteria bacterium]
MRLAPLLLLVSLTSCGGSSATTPDGGSATDASPSDARPSDAGPSSDAAAPANVGFITLLSDTAPAHARASATFLTGGPAYLCTEQPSGPCILYRCTPRPGASTRPAPHAGVVQLTGLTQPLSLTPATDGSYPASILQTTSLWAGGETLTASAPGASVPAFTTSVTTPRRITLSAPTLPTGDWMIDRAQPIALTWSGATAEDIIVTLGVITLGPLELECVFPASAGSATLPAAALGLLPAGDAYYTMVSRTRRQLDVSDWRITLRADTDAILPDARLVEGQAVLR